MQRTLDAVQPDAVIVEAPAGAERYMSELVHPDTKPPVALLSFTKSRPVHTFVLPFANYSPEWIACQWALQHDRELHFMDLPSEVFLALQALPATAGGEADLALNQEAFDPLTEVAKLAGAPDMETWWERTFEHTIDPQAYFSAARALGASLREIDVRGPAEQRKNSLREAHMRRSIRRVLENHAPQRVVVICGAFHVASLTADNPAMSENELSALPKAQTVLTLIPYSYARLHERSGYGAGNHAPSYYESLFTELTRDRPEQLASRFVTKVARVMRKKGHVRASAQVIDSVRLARALATTAGSSAITLCDLRDAAITCLGAGEPGPVQEALALVETAATIGRLPPGVSRTALQDDFRFQVARLKLDKYLSEQEQLLVLDLRENRRAKTKATAQLDQERSIFLQRTMVIDIPLATLEQSTQQATSWKEQWKMRWSPTTELRLAELSIVGDSIASATALALSDQLAASHGTGEAALVLVSAARCHLADALERSLVRVQEAAVSDDDLASIATATTHMTEVARYGGIRAVDPEPLWPLIAQLFTRGALLIPQAVLCDDAACQPLRHALIELSAVAAKEPSRVPVELFETNLRTVALGDTGHPHLIGVATALLLERGAIAEEQLRRSVARQLIPGQAPDAAAGFFEGLAAHNRMALFARRVVWDSLSTFVDALDGAELLAALAPLRRAFGDFSQGEVRRVTSSLKDIWDGDAAELSRAVEQPLSTDELEKLQDQLGDLGDLDL